MLLVGIVSVALLSFASSAESQGKKKANMPIWSDSKDAFGDPLPVGAVSRIGTVRYRMSNRAMFFMPVLSPDGKLLAMSGPEEDIELWEVPAWKKVQTIRSRDLDKKRMPNFQEIAFSADGKKIVASENNQPRVFVIDLAKGTTVKRITLPQRKGDNGGGRLVLSRDEKTLVWTVQKNDGKGQTREYLVWDVDKEKIRHTFEVPINAYDNQQSLPTITDDGRLLVQTTGVNTPNPRGGRGDSFLEFWDLSAGKSVRKIETDLPMTLTAFSPDGKWLAASSGQSILRIYEVESGKEKHNIRLRRSSVSRLVFAPDSASLYLADHDGTITRFDTLRGERLAESRTPLPTGSVSQISFGADGKARALAVYADALHFWDVATGKMHSPTGVPAGMIDDLTFSPGGELFVASEEGHAAWWNPRTAIKLRDLKLESVDFGRRDIFFDGLVFDGRFGNIRRGGGGGMVTMSSDGNFVSNGDGGAFGIYDARTGKLLYDDDNRNGNGGTGGFSFLNGGASAASLQQKRVRIWRTRSGRDLAHFDVPFREQEVSTRMEASPNGKYFVFAAINEGGQGGRVLLWDVDNKKLAREWPTQDRQDAMRFSPDNQWLAIASSRDQIRLTRLNKARGDHTLAVDNRNEEVTQLVFSPDGRVLACAMIFPSRNNNASKLFLYELASKKVRLELVGHMAGIIDRLAFSHDGALLASGASDTTVLVWRAGLRAFADKRADKDATAEDLQERYKQLGGADAKAAFQQMILLVQTPEQAVKLFEDKIAPAQKPQSGEKTVPAWIQDLSSSQFAIRNKANAALVKIGGTVEPNLREALKSAKDVETRRRIEALLDHFAAYEWTQDEVRQARAVEVLEAIGSPQARAALSRWSSGDPGAILTQQAREAIARLR